MNNNNLESKKYVLKIYIISKLEYFHIIYIQKDYKVIKLIRIKKFDKYIKTDKTQYVSYYRRRYKIIIIYLI